jgi:pimeloyl-ACP methyl ester carboxylesterase
MEYLVEGKGNPVLLLHGAGASALSNWQTTLEKLAAFRQVIVPNLPGAGNTSWTNEPLSVRALTTVLNALVEQEEVPTMEVVGYSTGAMIALALAGEVPQKVSKVMALAPWLHTSRQSFFFDFWYRLFLSSESLFASYNTITALSITAQGYMNEEAFAATQHAFAQSGFNSQLPILLKVLKDFDVQAYLPSITAKTSIIGFSEDLICPPANVREIAGKIKGALYSEILAGHAGPWEATEQMNEAITRFLLGERGKEVVG